MKKLTVALFSILLLSCAANAIDKEKLSDHLMKALNLDARAKIEIGDPTPSAIKGVKEVSVTINTHKRKIYISKNGKNYIWGEMFDLSEDPDKERMALINLEKVWSKGSSEAPVTIVEYTDLQCPYCKRAHEALEEELYESYKKDQVRLVFKHFPLANHKWAEPAAIASECAGQQKEDAFWKMSSKFFVDQSKLTEDNVEEKSIKFAKSLDLNKKKFEACLEDPNVQARVQKDKEEGLQVGVNSTPTLYVNGRMVRGFRNFDSLKPLIDEKLEE